MTNGGINVEIGNPSYNMYEVDHDNHADAGSLLRPNFTLDPHKVGLMNVSCSLPYALFKPDILPLMHNFSLKQDKNDMF